MHVHTEETWTGAQAEADVPTATAAPGAGLEAWLHDLAAAAEGRGPRAAVASGGRPCDTPPDGLSRLFMTFQDITCRI